MNDLKQIMDALKREVADIKGYVRGDLAIHDCIDYLANTGRLR